MTYPSQDLHLNRTVQYKQKRHIINAPSGIRTRNASVWAVQDRTRFIPHGLLGNNYVYDCSTPAHPPWSELWGDVDSR